MPTSPEILAIEEAHRAAQARLGVAGAYLSLRDWSGVSASAPAGDGDAWLTRSLQMIRAIRRKSVRLAKAYYQLARAIETGYTLGLPEYSTDPTAVTMGGLRKQYLDLLLEVADLDKDGTDRNVRPSPGSSDPDEQWLERELQTAAGEELADSVTIDFTNTDLDSYIEDLLEVTDPATDDSPVEVDEYDWEESDVTLKDIRDEYAEELRLAANERIAAYRRLKANEELNARQALEQADKIHNSAGQSNAGSVDRAGIDAGRDILNLAAGRDTRVMMWARITSGRPCAFCAMLASRGFVYLSRSRANVTTGGSKDDPSGGAMKSYHKNCHCSAIMRWADIPDATAPARTAHYEALWKEEMKGKRFASRGTKNDTLNHWRRIIYAERRAQRLAEIEAYRKSSNAKA